MRQLFMNSHLTDQRVNERNRLIASPQCASQVGFMDSASPRRYGPRLIRNEFLFCEFLPSKESKSASRLGSEILEVCLVFLPGWPAPDIFRSLLLITNTERNEDADYL